MPGLRNLIFKYGAGGGGVHMLTIPQYQLISRILSEDMENIGDWHNGGGVDPAEDAVNFYTGTKSIRVANGAVLSTTYCDLPSPFVLAADELLEIHIYPVGTISASALTFEFHNNLWGTFPNKFFNAGFTPSPGDSLRWHTALFGPGDVTFSGGMTWATEVRGIRINTVALAGSDYSYDTVYSKIKTTCTPAVMITFDDGLAEVYNTAYPLFAAHNMRATIYPITANIGVANYMTAAQILELRSRGWTVGNHTRSHSSFAGKTQAEINTFLANAEADLAAIGINGPSSMHFAYPFGAYSADGDAVLAARGYRTARTTQSAYPHNTLNYWPSNRLPARPLDNTTTLAFAQGLVDKAVLSRKVATFYGHKIGAAADANTWTASDLGALLAYAASLNVPVITMDDYYNLHSQDIQIPAQV